MSPDQIAAKYGGVPVASASNNPVAAKYGGVPVAPAQSNTASELYPNQNASPDNPMNLDNLLHLKGAIDTQKTNFANIFDPTHEHGLTTLKQNVGSGLQLGSMIAAGGAGAASIPALGVAGAATGAAQSGGAALSDNQDLQSAGQQAVEGAKFGGITGGLVGGFGKLLGNLGDKIIYSVIKPHIADVEDGFKLGTIKKYDLGGTLNQTLAKTQTQMKSLTDQLNQKLAGANVSLNLQEPFAQTVKDVTSQKGSLTSFGVNTRLDKALSQLQDEVTHVNQAGGLSIPDAQVVKQASGQLGAWSYGQKDADASATEKVYNAFYHNLKVAIEKASPDGVRGINQQLSELIPVMNAVIRRIPVAERNNAISLGDMIGLVGSTIHPAALGPTLVNLASKSGVAGNAFSKLGPAIQKTAPALSNIPSMFATGLQAQQTPSPTPGQ